MALDEFLRIAKLLEKALINEGEMRQELYEYELEDMLDELKVSMAQDNDDCIFAVTENNNDVAMVLIDKSGTVYINEEARSELQRLWQKNYTNNLGKLIPVFAQQLSENGIPTTGMKIV
jgi:exoribonuclease II